MSPRRAWPGTGIGDTQILTIGIRASARGVKFLKNWMLDSVRMHERVWTAMAAESALIKAGPVVQLIRFPCRQLTTGSGGLIQSKRPDRLSAIRPRPVARIMRLTWWNFPSWMVSKT